MKVLVTGGAGFIGSALVRFLIRETDSNIINFDCLTYAANPASLKIAQEGSRYHFEHIDITDGNKVSEAFFCHRPDAVIHLAAESHVDRSIEFPSRFIQTNILGTYNLVETAYRYYKSLKGHARDNFRFLHVSTDEVYGSLGATGVFDERSSYRPSSPYAASKAASDHLVNAWSKTFGLPTLISNCTNNYGPWQFPEKLIPMVIIKALEGNPIPIYGDGKNVRQWLYVDDHVEALWHILLKGKIGESYNVSGVTERNNLEIAIMVCKHLDESRPRLDGAPHEKAITFVQDRPGHDFRYALDTGKILSELGWSPKYDFNYRIRETVDWYVQNEGWWRAILKSNYDGERQGLI